MANKVLMATFMSSIFALTGCGSDSSSSSSSDSPTNSNNVTITAMDGYLYKAQVFQQDANGICLTDEEALGTTDENGQLSVALTELANGYCVVTTTDTIDQDFPDQTLTTGYTLYSPAPRLLGTADAPVISPLTTYIQTVIDETQTEDSSATEQEILNAIETAKTELSDALGLDGDSEEITKFLVADYVAADSEAASSLHVMAQLLVGINDQEAPADSEQIINIATAARDQIADIAENITDQTNTELLASIVVYIENNIDNFADESNVADLSSDINNPSLLAQLPQPVSFDADSLQTQLQVAIDTTSTNSGDNSVNLVLTDTTLSGITDSDESEITYVLTQKKSGSIWNADIVATASDSSQEFTINELTFNQYGTFEFEIYTQKTITNEGIDTSYNSRPIAFTVEITSDQVANTAPVYNGDDSDIAIALFEELKATAEDSYIFDGSAYGLESSFSMTIRNNDLNALFLDDTNRLSIASNDADAYFYYNDSTGLYSYSLGDITVPAEGSSSTNLTLYAIDDHGAKSEQTFNYTVVVSSDFTATVTSSTDSIEDSVSEAVYGEEFIGIMLPTSYLETLEAQVESYLNGTEVESDPALEQILSLYAYQCAEDNTCVQNDGYEGAYSLNDSTYLTVDDSIVGNTKLQATGTTLSEIQYIQLVPKVNGESVSIYEVSSRTSLEISDIDDFGNFIELEISPDTGAGIIVTARLLAN